MAFKNFQSKETKMFINEQITKPYDPIRMVVEHEHLLKSYLLLRLIKNKPKSSSFWDLGQLEHELLLHLSRLICGDVENLNTQLNPREIYEYLLDRYKHEIDSSFCLSGGGGGKGPGYPKTNRSSIEEVQQDPNLSYYLDDDTEINDPNVKRFKILTFLV